MNGSMIIVAMFSLFSGHALAVDEVKAPVADPAAAPAADPAADSAADGVADSAAGPGAPPPYRAEGGSDVIELVPLAVEIGTVPIEDEALPMVVESAARPSAPGFRRSGLYGWGVGFEFPMIGILGGYGSDSNSKIGAGYNLGGAVSWETTENLVLRLYGAGGATSGGAATIEFLRRGALEASTQRADWLTGELGIGGAWLFRRPSQSWAPYVGGDLGVAFSGYEYRFDEDVSDLEAEDRTTQFEEGGHYGLAFGLTVGARAGVRFELTPWLSTIAGIGLSYARVPDDTVSNTLTTRDVRSVAERVLIARGTFSIRLGL